MLCVNLLNPRQKDRLREQQLLLNKCEEVLKNLIKDIEKKTKVHQEAFGDQARSDVRFRIDQNRWRCGGR